MRASRRAATFFLLAASYRFCADQGAWPGSRWSPARPEARGGRCRQVRQVREGKGTKGKRESCWKSGGGRVRLYTWRRTGLADEVGSDAIPDAAGGEAVTGPLDRMA
jgi:hypothetical protein